MAGKYTSRRIKRSKSRDGWVLYLMVHFPLICFVKIGITGRTAFARARDIDEAIFGFPVPVFALVIPGAYFFEQMLHSLCSPLQARFYDGDGASEWFVCIAAIPALILMCAGWFGYAWLIEQATGIPITGFLLDMCSTIFVWVVGLIRGK